MEKVKLNELVDIYLGVTHTPEYVFEGVPFLSVKDISGGKICFDDCKYISQEEYNSLSEGAKPKVGDMLFCRVGTLGKPIIIPEGTPLFGSFVSLGYLRNKDEDRCNLNYLRYWMYSNSFWKQVNSNVKGASQVNLNTGWLSKFDIDLPDINEQKYRISVLDKCKTIIEQREAELGKLDDLIKARFVEMFGDVKTNPNNYPKCPIKKVLKSCEAGWSGNGTQRDKGEDEIAVLKVSSVTKGYFIPEECKVLDDQENIKKFVTPEKGDLIFSRANTREMVGATAIIKEDYPTLILPDKLWKIRFENSVNVFYMKCVLSSKSIREEFSAASTGTSGSMYNVSMDKFKNVEVPIAPIEMQNQFAAFVKQVDKSKFDNQFYYYKCS